MFATAGPSLDLWSMTRNEPIQTFSWGADTITSVRFNPVETNILASTADDRNICLYDVRAATPIRKVCRPELSHVFARQDRLVDSNVTRLARCACV